MVNLKDLAWPSRKEIERDLIHLVKPPPTDDAEREELTIGLIELSQRIEKLKPFPHNWNVWVTNALKQDVKRVAKAAELLDECGPTFADIVKDLRGFLAGADESFAASKRPSNRPREIGRAKAVDLCQTFLRANHKHAGMGATGGAVVLAQAIWELVTLNHHTGAKDGVSTAALSQLAKRRARDKTLKKTD